MVSILSGVWMKILLHLKCSFSNCDVVKDLTSKYTPLSNITKVTFLHNFSFLLTFFSSKFNFQVQSTHFTRARWVCNNTMRRINICSLIKNVKSMSWIFERNQFSRIIFTKKIKVFNPLKLSLLQNHHREFPAVKFSSLHIKKTRKNPLIEIQIFGKYFIDM